MSYQEAKFERKCDSLEEKLNQLKILTSNNGTPSASLKTKLRENSEATVSTARITIDDVISWAAEATT